MSVHPVTIQECNAEEQLQRSFAIEVTSGLGRGPTKLAAFDAALREARIANFNLIHLSSVIPADTAVRVRRGAGGTAHGSWGDRLYVVIAEMRVEHPGETAFAGLGWVQDELGRGLFVEHIGHTEYEVSTSIDHTLTSMTMNRPERFGAVERLIVGTTVEREPACALVAAVYEAASWTRDPSPDEIDLT